MKKYISILALLLTSTIFAQFINYKPLYIYNYSAYDLEIEVNTCNQNSVFDGSMSNVVLPTFKSPSTFRVGANGGTFSFDYSMGRSSGLSFMGTDVPNMGFWRGTSLPVFGTPSLQVTYGRTQKWWYAKLGIWAANGDYVAGNLGNWGNTVTDGYSVLIGNHLRAEWIEVPGDPNYPEYYTTYIIIS